MPALIYREGPLAGYRYDVSQEMSIGRENAAITLQDGEVSRRHAVIRPVEGGVEIQDLGSTNGTWLNERRITTPTVVRPGDVLRVGQTSFTVELDRAVAPPQAPPPRGTQVSARIPASAPVRAASPAAGQGGPVIPPPQRDFQGGSPPSRPRVATRGIVPVWVTFGVIVATAVLLVLYFAVRGSG